MKDSDKPLESISFQKFREAVWPLYGGVTYPHGMDRLLIKVHDATFKELVNWGLNWLMLLDYEERQSQFANKGEK